MRIDYELIPRDFTSAIFAHYNRRWWTRWGRRMLMAAVVILAILATVSAIFSGRAGSLLLAPASVVVLWVFVLWGMPYLSGRNQYRSQPAAKGPHTIEVDAVGASHTSPMAESRVAWSTYVDFVESSDVMLLYLSSRFFHIIPKRAFTPAQLDEFRAIVLTHVGQKARATADPRN